MKNAPGKTQGRKFTRYHLDLQKNLPHWRSDGRTRARPTYRPASSKTMFLRTAVPASTYPGSLNG